MHYSVINLKRETIELHAIFSYFFFKPTRNLSEKKEIIMFCKLFSDGQFKGLNNQIFLIKKQLLNATFCSIFRIFSILYTV